MNEKTLKILEFDKIREMLADCAMTDGAKKKALSIRPLPTLREVNLHLDRTTDAKKLSNVKGAPPFFSVSEGRDSTDRAKKGALLSLRELLNCALVYRCARSLSDYAGEEGMASSLGEIFSRLKINRHLEDTFSRCIVSEELIADEASAELADIRTRGGRYVIPVKSEYRNEVSGLVHDTSSSGSTIFIEPMAVVEANNELRTLEGKEAREIEKIVYTLSAEVGMWADDIDENEIIVGEKLPHWAGYQKPIVKSYQPGELVLDYNGKIFTIHSGEEVQLDYSLFSQEYGVSCYILECVKLL